MKIDFYYCTKKIQIKDKIIQLVNMEFNVLAYIYFRIGKIVNSYEILSYLYDDIMYISNTVANYISRINIKAKQKIISNKHGFGYYITGSI